MINLQVLKYRWNSKISRTRRGLYTEIRSSSIPERPKEDAKKIVEYILEQSGDGKKAPIRVKSCCCRPCGMDMERKHQFKEMRFREMYYDHEADLIANPPPSHDESPELELPIPKTKKLKK